MLRSMKSGHTRIFQGLLPFFILLVSLFYTLSIPQLEDKRQFHTIIKQNSAAQIYVIK